MARQKAVGTSSLHVLSNTQSSCYNAKKLCFVALSACVLGLDEKTQLSQHVSDKWKKTRGSCDVVKYSDAYITMLKTSPFARKEQQPWSFLLGQRTVVAWKNQKKFDRRSPVKSKKGTSGMARRVVCLLNLFGLNRMVTHGQRTYVYIGTAEAG